MNLIYRFKMLLRFFYIWPRYKPKYYVRIKGKVYFENNNIQFGKNNVIYDGVKFRGKGKIILGDNVDIGSDTIIYSDKEILIKDNTMIAGQCYIIDCDHGTKKNELMRNQPLNTEKIIIGSDVWIAAGVKVLKGAIIPDGVVIGAMSLITKKTKMEVNNIYAGLPAKKISERK